MKVVMASLLYVPGAYQPGKCRFEFFTFLILLFPSTELPSGRHEVLTGSEQALKRGTDMIEE